MKIPTDLKLYNKTKKIYIRNIRNIVHIEVEY